MGANLQLVQVLLPLLQCNHGRIALSYNLGQLHCIVSFM